MKRSLEGSKRHQRENSGLDLDMQVISTVGCKVNNEINMLKSVKQNTVSTIPGPFSPGATVSPTNLIRNNSVDGTEEKSGDYGFTA